MAELRLDVAVPLRSFELRVALDVAAETVAIVGPSGAGKSTIVQILLRLREPGSGNFLVNGVPASEYAPEDWHRRVAYVPQEPRLTPGGRRSAWGGIR